MPLARRIGAAVVALLCVTSSPAQGLPTVAAAADLKFALTEIAEHFRRETGRAVKLTFGSSGTFKTQIENGAPFELFLSADENYVLQLADKGLVRDRGTLYAVGRIVLFAPHGSPLKVDGELKGLKTALAEGQIRRFAIANPEHAPYGRAARAALQHAGLWAGIEKTLVLGENAAQAAQFAASGSSQGGIIPLSLSKAPEVARLGRFALIPAEWHAIEPLRQRMVLTAKAGETAAIFYRYLQQPAAREVFVRYGFVLPEEATK
ncbi:molybdate ABC transporter substrate-binding protein [Pelomicrobium sp.]|jgi:molybdate transport system substrate-binding protein|uniref:molybdate ABC transporter substrate-binding protein n=1 Tax=Pelomicrobium sp. TaxID=2815319 RepID=UPI002FDE59EA